MDQHPEEQLSVRKRMSRAFSSFATWIAKELGSHWAVGIAAVLVGLSLLMLGIAKTNIAISVVTLLMVFVLQHTQHRDSVTLHMKMDEVITRLEGPRDEVAGIEQASVEEIERLRGTDPTAYALADESPSG